MEVTIADLLHAIDELTQIAPLASSEAVKEWLDAHGIAWNVEGRSGALLEAVDREIAMADEPVLDKWKAGRPRVSRGAAPAPQRLGSGWPRTAGLA